MSKKQNWLVIIAGPNGAGKSTFYNNKTNAVDEEMIAKAVECAKQNDIAHK